MLQKMDYVSLGCSALAFVLYLNTLNSGFVYDDRRAILANTDVSGNTPWYAAFKNDFWGTPLTDSGSHGSYRPLCVLSFRLNFFFGGYTAWSFHLVNNLMHCLATGLVVKLARYFFSSFWGVVATGALFAVHPIHTEAVAGIVGRADLAACIFYLLTYLTYMKHIRWREHCDPRQWFALAMTVVLSVLALLFKETAISVLFTCGLFDVIRGLCGINDKNRFRSLVILGVALISSVCYRLVLLPRPQTAFSTADNPIAKSNSVLTRFLTFAYLPVFNFKLMLNSHVLSFDWGMDAIPRITCFSDKRNIFTLCFYSALLWVIWRTVNTLLNNKINQALSEQTIPAGSQYHIQQATHRKSRTKRKSRTVCLPPTSSKNINNNTTYNLLEESKIENTPAHLSYKPANILPVVKPKVLRCLCYECKQDMSAGHHTSTCRVINNNNNLVVNNAASIFNDCCCHQIVSSRAVDIEEPVQTLVPHHVIAVAFLKAITGVNPRNSRSSSSCSNSTTLSEKSSGSSAYSSSSSTSNTSTTSITNTMNFHKSHNYLLTHVPPKSQSACVLLMAVAFLTLPFLPATNLFVYVGFVVAERLLYLPSVGYCLLVGFGVTKLMMLSSTTRQNNQKHKLAVIMFMSLALTSMSVRTVRRNLDWRNEESLYRSAIEVNPPKALGNLGSVLSSQGRYDEAKIALAEALKFRPNMADVHFNLGILHQNQQNYKSAIECFQRAIHFRPNLAVAYLNLGISLIAMGKCQEATQALQKCTKLDGIGVRDRVAHDNARISSYLQLGALYVEQGKLQRSLAVYREALHTLPTSIYQRDVLYHRIGDIFGRLHQWDEAEKHHRVALEMQPNHVGAHLSYGITLARNTSRALEAEMWFKRALQLAPQQASVYHHYAEFLIAQARAEEAIFYRVRAAEISPQDYSLAVAAATAYRLLDRKTDAELWYRKAVALRPNDAHAHTNLGAILHLLGRTSKAAASYKEALRLQPGDPTTLSNLAKLGVTAETE